jgi:hypothetical protein
MTSSLFNIDPGIQMLAQNTLFAQKRQEIFFSEFVLENPPCVGMK